MENLYFLNDDHRKVFNTLLVKGMEICYHKSSTHQGDYREIFNSYFSALKKNLIRQDGKYNYDYFMSTVYIVGAVYKTILINTFTTHRYLYPVTEEIIKEKDELIKQITTLEENTIYQIKIIFDEINHIS